MKRYLKTFVLLAFFSATILLLEISPVAENHTVLLAKSPSKTPLTHQSDNRDNAQLLNRPKKSAIYCHSIGKAQNWNLPSGESNGHSP